MVKIEYNSNNKNHTDKLQDYEDFQYFIKSLQSDYGKEYENIGDDIFKQDAYCDMVYNQLNKNEYERFTKIFKTIGCYKSKEEYFLKVAFVSNILSSSLSPMIKRKHKEYLINYFKN